MSEEFDPYRKWLGIPPEEQPAHNYRLLGITPFEDDPDVIENAADRQMAHVRTFQSGRHSKLSQLLLNQLAVAKGCLLDPSKKDAYDEELRTTIAPQPPGEPEPPIVAPPLEMPATPTDSADPPIPLSAMADVAEQAAAPIVPKSLKSTAATESKAPAVGVPTPVVTNRSTTSRRVRARNRFNMTGVIVGFVTVVAVVLLFVIISFLMK